MSALLDAASWACLVAGGLSCIVGAAGMLRMPDFYTRVHAASVIDTVGAGLILFGLALQSPHWLVIGKLGALGLLLYFTSPTATHALCKAALGRGLRPRLADDGEPPPSKP